MNNLAFFETTDKYNEDSYNDMGNGTKEINVGDNIITDVGRKILSDKIRNLLDKKPGLSEEVAIARENGGMEENEELEMALNAIERVDMEIKKCESILKTYRHIQIPPEGEYEKVLLGCKVDLHNLTTKVDVTYQILGEIETDPSNGIISMKSPLGKELMGLYEGDIAEIERGNNDYIEYEVVKIYID